MSISIPQHSIESIIPQRSRAEWFKVRRTFSQSSYGLLFKGFNTKKLAFGARPPILEIQIGKRNVQNEVEESDVGAK